MKRKLLSALFIFLGIGLLSYPTVSEKYNDYKQEQILAEWKETMKDLDDEEEIIKEPIEEENRYEVIKRKDGGLEGVLKIDKIDLELPILTGASHENMKTSVASIEHTGFPGEFGNYAISGHRNLTYGRNFNRLNEVDVDDIIKVGTEDGEYNYKVFDKYYVNPEDTWVLNEDKDIREITLITCHPPKIASHRLIIKGEIID